jgi:hypothetical protein
VASSSAGSWCGRTNESIGEALLVARLGPPHGRISRPRFRPLRCRMASGTWLADALCRADHRPGRSARSKQGNRFGPLTCGFGARGRIRIDDLPLTSRMFGVSLDGSRRIQAAHVGCAVGPDGSRRIQKDRLDDHRDDQGASDRMSDGQISNRGRYGRGGPDRSTHLNRQTSRVPSSPA